MDQLWILGFLGGGAGAALGLPYAVSKADKRNDLSGAERLLGMWLVGIGIALALIGAEHGNLINGPAARIAGHVSRMMNLLAWPMMVVATSRIAQRTLTRFERPAFFVMPLVVYLIAMVLLGGRSMRFVWVLPASIYAAVRIAYLWHVAHRDNRLSADTRRLIGGLAALAVSLAMAQTIRTFAPRFEPMREIVPIVVTVGCFWLATVIRARLVAVTPPTVEPVVVSSPISAPRYARSGLTEASASTLMERLDIYMKEEELYLHPDLSLQSIADRLGETPHVVSQAVNQFGGRSLNAYLAAWRVRHAQRELADPANKCYTVEAIGARSGFASRSAFYRAFREHVGMTPAAYAASMTERASAVMSG